MPNTKTNKPSCFLFIIFFVIACSDVEKNDAPSNRSNSPLYSEGHQDLFKFLKTGADVIMLGDSLTDENEWHEFFSDIKIINRGIRGQSSQQVLDRIQPILRTEAKYTFVMVGINDILRNYSAASIVDNSREILSLLKEKNHKPILQSILYVSEDQKETNKRIKEANRQLIQLANELNVDYIDLNTILAPNGYLEKIYTYDGIHLTGNGYDMWVKQIAPIIESI